MNETQRRYARDRINSIAKDKLSEAQALCQTKANTLTCKDKLAALKNGEYTIIKDGYSSSWCNHVKFNAETESTFDNARYTKLSLAINSQKTSILDDLMLGDEAKALEAIRAFAEYKIS